MASWEEFVVRRHGRQRPGVDGKAGDDRGRVGQPALGETDNTLLGRGHLISRMTIRDGPTRTGDGVDGVRRRVVAACFDRDHFSAYRPDREGRADAGGYCVGRQRAVQ